MSETPVWKKRVAKRMFKEEKQTKDIAKGINMAKSTIRRWRQEWRKDPDAFYNREMENHRGNSAMANKKVSNNYTVT